MLGGAGETEKCKTQRQQTVPPRWASGDKARELKYLPTIPNSETVKFATYSGVARQFGGGTAATVSQLFRKRGKDFRAGGKREPGNR